MACVFVSHSSVDNALASEFKAWLEGEGFESVFLDIDERSGIAPGANWESELYRKIEAAQAVILLITSHWHESKWCFVEFAQARALGKATFPVVVAPDSTRYIAPDIQQLDLQVDREGGLQRLSQELLRLATDAQGGFSWDRRRAPFPGFLFFDEDDAAIFFGRDDDIRVIIERLNACRIRARDAIVLLLGASGSGKSSVMRAGVLPRLKRDRRNWLVLPPFRPGANPVDELARSICEVLGEQARWKEWSAALQGAERRDAIKELVATIRLLPGAREAKIMLPIDQGEELFTVALPDERDTFFRVLTDVVSAGILPLLALRSDCLEGLQAADHLPTFEEVSLRPFALGRVRVTIQGPARVAGVSVEPELIDQIIQDMGTEDALPLLAFALRELYDEAAKRSVDTKERLIISLANYLNLSRGDSRLNPLENTIQRRASEVLESLHLSEVDESALREAFVGAMVRVNADGIYAKKRAIWADLPTRAAPILERLAEARLCIISSEEGRKIVEVTHEALLRQWPLLRGWLDDRRDFLVGRNQLSYALNAWQDSEKDTRALLKGMMLARAKEWLQEDSRSSPDTKGRMLSSEERDFVIASVDFERIEQRRKSMSRWVTGTVAAFALVITGVFIFIYRENAASQLRAEAASLVVQARSIIHKQPLLSLNLSSRAVSLSATPETYSALLASILTISPHTLRIRPIGSAGSIATFRGNSDIVLISEVRDRGEEIISWHSTGREAVKASAQRSPERLPLVSRILDFREDRESSIAVYNDGHVQLLNSNALVTDKWRLPGIEEASRVSIGASGNMLVEDAATGDVFLMHCARAVAGETGSCQSKKIASGFPEVIRLNDAATLAAFIYDGERLTIADSSKDWREVGIDLPKDTFIQSLAWSPDGSRLAVGTTVGQIIVMDQFGNILAEVQRAGKISHVVWSADSLRIATVCETYTVCVFNVRQSSGTTTLRIMARLEGHSGPITAIALSPSGDRVLSLAAEPDDTARLWAVTPTDAAISVAQTWERQATLTSVGVSADENWLAAGDDQGALHIWSLGRLGQETLVRGEGSPNTSLAWSPFSAELASADKKGAVKIRGWPANADLGGGNLGEAASALAWRTDEPSVLIAGKSDGSINQLRRGALTLDRLDRQNNDAVLALAMSPDKKIFIATDSKKLVRWTLPSLQVKDVRELPLSMDTVAFTRDGNRYLIAGNGGDLYVHHAESHELVGKCQSGSRQLDAALFDSNGTAVAAISSDAILYVWGITDRCSLLASAPLPASEARNLTLRPTMALIPSRDAIAVAASTRQVFVISLKAETWLNRANAVVGEAPLSPQH